MSQASESSAPRLRLRITPAAEAAVRSGHPWVFAESIREQNREGEAGELGVVYDRHNRFLAVGFYDPDSPIRLRVLHTGSPQTIDTDWWCGRLQAAVERRAGLFSPETTGFRLINGESDGWPGLVLDRYDTTLVLKLYTPAWLPRLDEVTTLIGEQIPNERIILRLSRNMEQSGLANGTVLSGEPLDGAVRFLENGTCFEAEVLRGQKTGFFLDQRENRVRVGSLSAGCDVLNAFSFSGGFSLYAARGGARSVTDVDISAHALESARRNFALNPGLRSCRREPVQADVFEWLRSSTSRDFDLVILDPPSLAHREAQRAEAIRAYGRLNASGIARLRRGGVLVAASCSAHVSAEEFFGAVRQAARRSGRTFRELATTRHAPDHPATFTEAEYLKAVYLRMD